MKSKKILIALLILFVLFAGLKAMLIIRPSDRPLCERIDSATCIITEQVYNDIDEKVEISLCSPDKTYGCQKTAESYTLGRYSYHQNTIDPRVEQSRVWLVKDDNLEILGCVVFKYTKKDAPFAVSIPISRLVSCEGYWGE